MQRDKKTHRVAARVFEGMFVGAVYADAQRADLDAARRWKDEAEHSGKQCAMLIGDWNYRPALEKLRDEAWTMAEPIPCSKVSQHAAPTRALVKGIKAKAIEAVDLPGVPTHKAVVFQLEMPEQVVETGWRATRAAQFTPQGKHRPKRTKRR